MGNYESGQDVPPASLYSTLHQETKNGTHQDEDVPFGRTLSQKVLLKVFAYLAKTSAPGELASNINLKIPVTSSNPSTTAPGKPIPNTFSQCTYNYHIKMRVDIEPLVRLFNDKTCIIDEILLDYTENDYPFNMVIFIRKLVAEYNLSKFVEEVITKTTNNNIALATILTEKHYKRFPCTKVILPKEYRGTAKRSVIYRLFEDNHSRPEILGMIQKKFSMLEFFKIQQQNGHVILLGNHSMTLNLLKWGVLEVPNLSYEKPEEKQSNQKLMVPRLISNFSDCIIPKADISVLTGVRVNNTSQEGDTSPRSPEPSFGFKIDSTTYFNTMVNLCQRIGLTKLVPIKGADDCTFEISLTPEEEEVILQRLVEISNFNESMTSTKTELCNFILDIKLLY